MINLICKPLTLFSIFSSLIFAQTNDWQRMKSPLTLLANEVHSFVRDNNNVVHSITNKGIFRYDLTYDEWLHESEAVAYSILFNNNGEMVIGANGLWISTDTGKTWTRTSIDESPYEILIKDKKGIIFAGSSDAGVLTSMDNGYSWTLSNSGLTGNNITSLAYDSTNTIYASVYNKGFFRSTDHGNNWVLIKGTPPFTKILSIHIDSLNHIFIGTDGNGILLTTDGGNSWNAPLNILSHLSLFSITHFQNGNLITASRINGIFISTDNGNSWIQRPNTISTAPLLAIYPFGINNLFAGTTEGLYCYSDENTSWEPKNVIGKMSGITNYSIMLNSRSTLYAEFSNSFPALGVMKSTDKGENWYPIYISANRYDMTFSFSLNADDNLFLSTANNGLLRSLDDGKSWLQLLYENKKINALSILVIPNGNIFVAAFEQPQITIMKSTDKGDTWHKLYTTTGNGYDKLFYNQNNGHIYYSGMKTTDSGKSWVQINDSFHSLECLSFNSQNEIFAIYNGPSGGAVLHSSDDSRQLMEIFSLTSKRGIGGLVIDGNDNIYIGTTEGVFKSTDTGVNWNSFSNGITEPGNKLTMDKDGYLYITTFYTSYFKTLTPITSITNDDKEKISGDFVLSQNYPNPFNPLTNIEYRVPEKSILKISIYDINGRMIKTLVNEGKNEGNYSVQWNGRDDNGNLVATGIYYYQVQTNSFIKAKKMLLIK